MVDKVITVIKSCKTHEQLVASKRFLYLYLNTIKSVRERCYLYNELIVYYDEQCKLIEND